METNPKAGDLQKEIKSKLIAQNSEQESDQTLDPLQVSRHDNEESKALLDPKNRQAQSSSNLSGAMKTILKASKVLDKAEKEEKQ